MLYVDNKNNIYEDKPQNTKVEQMMTIKEASQKWNVEGSWARRIVTKVPGARQLIINGRNTWCIPASAEKPTKDIKRR